MEGEVAHQRLAHQRLARHRLVGEPLPSAEAVVGHLVAVQAQDFAGAKWGIAQRTTPTTDTALDALFDRGALLRTHLLRPTWHLVLRADIRWLLALTAPRVHQANGTMYRKLELDDALLARADNVIGGALRDGAHKTRPEVAAVLAGHGIVASGLRLGYLLMHAELEALICSGPRRGKQHTYALLDERVPRTPGRTREEALAELARRYLASRAPATAHDLATWSGLTLTDVKTALASLGTGAVQETVASTTYWLPADAPPPVPFQEPRTKHQEPVVHLLPNYDEYVSSYKDSTPILTPEIKAALASAPTTLDAHLIAIDGQITGGWRREVKGRTVTVSRILLRPLTEPEESGFGHQVVRYAQFLDASVVVNEPRSP